MENQFESLDFNEQLEELVIEQARKLINQNSYTKSILTTLPIALVATDKMGNVHSFNNTAKKLLCLSNGKKLTECFSENSSLQSKIENCLYKEEKYTLNSQKLTTQENVVNIYIYSRFMMMK